MGVAKFSTSERKNIAASGSKRSIHSQTELFTGCIELDTYANTIVFRNNCIVLQYTGFEYDVSPNVDSFDSIKGVPLVQAETAWTSPETYQTY